MLRGEKYPAVAGYFYAFKRWEYVQESYLIRGTTYLSTCRMYSDPYADVLGIGFGVDNQWVFVFENQNEPTSKLMSCRRLVSDQR